MYLFAAKLTRPLFWAALATGILGLLMPDLVPLWLALILAIGCGLLFLYTGLHVRRTRRFEWQCSHCGWVPFALDAWKCKECGFVWDAFDTGGVCPRCGHRHEETACLRCRRVSPNRQWAMSSRCVPGE
jgi:rubredoxin